MWNEWEVNIDDGIEGRTSKHSKDIIKNAWGIVDFAKCAESVGIKWKNIRNCEENQP